MKLENIGFYTLSDERVENVSPVSPMSRCEMIVTTRCNFACEYCRGPSVLPEDCREDIDVGDALNTLNLWIKDGLKNVRFSGGEPTLYPHLVDLVETCFVGGVERIAISSNGSQPHSVYEELVEAGVNDWSISLDACCAGDGDAIAVSTNSWNQVVKNIRYLATRTYVTVGVVLTDDNVSDVVNIVEFAHNLGVADIRIISAAQTNQHIGGLDKIPSHILSAHPILKYRVEHFLAGRNVRGIEEYDANRCSLILDDSVVAGNSHFPCVIYMREGGDPIGRVGEGMREDRVEWATNHNTHCDEICKKNCLDVCVDYNNKYAMIHGGCHHNIPII